MSKTHEDLMQDPAYQAKLQELKARFAKQHPVWAAMAEEAGFTGLHYAAMLKYQDEAEQKADIDFFIQCGADVNGVLKQDGRTPLHFAALQNNVAAIKELIKHGGNVHATDQEGKTPLHWAARNGHVAAIKELRKHGGNIYAGDDFGDTPLHWASLCAQVAAIKELIECGSNVNNHDYTPLQRLIEEGDELYNEPNSDENSVTNSITNSIWLLLSAGASISSTDAWRAEHLGAMPKLTQHGEMWFKEDPSHPGQPVREPAAAGRDLQVQAVYNIMRQRNMLEGSPLALLPRDVRRLIAARVNSLESLHGDGGFAARVLEENRKSPAEVIEKQQAEAQAQEQTNNLKRGRTEEAGDGWHESALPDTASTGKRLHAEAGGKKRGRDAAEIKNDNNAAGIVAKGKKSHVEKTGEPRGRE